MGSTDDLDDFEAELEIALKKEYATVFPLFTYCVITQEATYLCNKLKVDCVPHAAYLLFDIQMEDVWVWDRNRPTRIIPRAQIYTTADVTVEQLRDAPEGDFDAAIPSGLLEQIRADMAAEAAFAEGEAEDEDEVEAGEAGGDASPGDDD